jgi:hypothetical protein
MRHSCFGVAQPVVVDQGNDLRQPFVQLIEDESIERDAAGEQPVEDLARHRGDAGIPQRNDVVPARLAL